jgi:hypothetical protein
MTLADGLSFQAIGLSGKRMTSLPEVLAATALLASETKKKNAGRGNNCLGPTFCCDMNGIQGTILANKYQGGQITEYTL